MQDAWTNTDINPYLDCIGDISTAIGQIGLMYLVTELA